MSSPRQYEYRIQYKPNESLTSNYHYYLAESAEQALGFQQDMIENKKWHITILAVEKKNPYSDKWEDESEILIQEND